VTRKDYQLIAKVLRTIRLKTMDGEYPRRIDMLADLVLLFEGELKEANPNFNYNKFRQAVCKE